jgi:hypothetical protein
MIRTFVGFVGVYNLNLLAVIEAANYVSDRESNYNSSLAGVCRNCSGG